MDILTVGFHMQFHAKHSGYTQLMKYIQSHNIYQEELTSWIVQLPLRLRHKILTHSGLQWYEKDSLATEAAVVIKMLLNDNKIFHFLYGENLYRYSGHFSRIRKHKILCTYHLPPKFFHASVHYTKHLRDLNGIIVVARNQIEFFSQFIPEERIFLVPHGIDTGFFHPPSDFSVRSQDTCLFVGHWLRDFETLRKVITIVHKKKPSVRFVIVTKRSNFNEFQERQSNVFLETEISDERLKTYYQDATMLLQPFYDCTANNAVLEGLSCGCPIIASDTGGIRDYVDDSCALLVPPLDPESMSEAVFKLLEDRALAQDMSENCRQKALLFSWPQIARTMKDVYQRVREM